ncbi:hypothetical protein RFI_25850 [Reticulomyxa filosa]|uniref:Protein kinase domain-containing protein n=1 Tax=Reticulomyxa filosa TaxID=46433 RepID=X6MEP9_RETFI|nr:hypothetical protein RFI_25850 [Reticulomyxa filosa]|eukprot:ETO11530.1 hypothetical protein RFI_25850 [Reticulomyxa filosa]
MQHVQQFVALNATQFVILQPQAVLNWPLNNVALSRVVTNVSNDNVNVSTLLTKFSTCKYLALSEKKAGELVSPISNYTLEGNRTAAWKPRFDSPDKLLGNTLQEISLYVHIFYCSKETIPLLKKKKKGYTVRCFDRKDRQYRCVKAALKSLVNNKKSLKHVPVAEDFLREEQLLKKMSHMKDFPKTICKYITHWESDLFYFLSTEYCLGGNLFQYMVNILHTNPKFHPGLFTKE